LYFSINKIDERYDFSTVRVYSCFRYFSSFFLSKQPVLPTDYGVNIIEQARKILAQRELLLEMVDEKKGIIHGELKI
jgi:hypothetical protein